MKHNILKFWIFGVLAALLLPFYGLVTTTALTKFSCGSSDLVTYKVTPLDDNHKGPGIRCVKFSNNYDNQAPLLSWYGEGNWDGCSYRHVGQAFYSKTEAGFDYLTGYSSDIHGNGECRNNSFDGNLQIKADFGKNSIYVIGPWNELWTKVDIADYYPQSKPLVCGDKNGGYFDQYYVVDSLSVFKGGRYGLGLRCMLKVGGKNLTWFGDGWWNNFSSTYSQLGNKGVYYKNNLKQLGYGASNISQTGFGSSSSIYEYGSINFIKRSPRGFYVNGQLRETWF